MMVIGDSSFEQKINTNMYYENGATALFQLNGTSYTTLPLLQAAWQTDTKTESNDENSIVQNPGNATGIPVGDEWIGIPQIPVPIYRNRYNIN
jgi:hypothetical protein